MDYENAEILWLLASEGTTASCDFEGTNTFWRVRVLKSLTHLIHISLSPELSNVSVSD